MIVPRLIERKRDGERLEPREIRDLVLAYAEGQVPIPDAACHGDLLRGLDRDEMTREDAMLESGRGSIWPPSNASNRQALHGGVGDKTSSFCSTHCIAGLR